MIFTVHSSNKIDSTQHTYRSRLSANQKLVKLLDNGEEYAYIEENDDNIFESPSFKYQECSRFIMENSFGYCDGSVIEYVSRFNNSGDVGELKKAKYYLNMLINDLEKDDEIT